MNDRFKFRGVLTVTYGGENADDKTIDLIIEKADAIYGGYIGFDIDQLDSAIEKAGITDDIEIDQIHEFCYDNNGCRSDEYFVMDGDIEQCTGLKDKNGNLIYEGDYIKDRFTSVYIIKWVDAKFLAIDIAEIQPDNSPNQKWLNWNEFEIIGNIHEQAEQKDVK